jgi:hypothetical protein
MTAVKGSSKKEKSSTKAGGKGPNGLVLDFWISGFKEVLSSQSGD